MDAIDQFFSQYPDFDYNRELSSETEFNRMCDKFGSRRGSNDGKKATRDFRIAVVATFNNSLALIQTTLLDGRGYVCAWG